MVLVPFEELKAIYGAIAAEEGAGAPIRLTYTEFRDKFIKGIDGIRVGNIDINGRLEISWYTAEKLNDPDKENGGYVSAAKTQTDLK